jgi:hypothetical protein
MSRTKPALVQEKRCVLGSENNVSVTLPRPNRFVLVPDDVRGSKCGIRLFLVGLSRFDNSQNVKMRVTNPAFLDMES